MRRVALLSIALMLALSLIDARHTQALPAFARREGVQCQMCHFRMPELNEDGHAYVRRGLREQPRGKMGGMPEASGMTMPVGEQPAKTPVAAITRPLGQPLSLQWADYLTIMGHHMFVAERGSRAKFDAGVIDLWAAGPLDRHWSGLANPSFNIEEGGSDVEQAYGQYITQWSERFGSARFGQVMPFAVLFNQGGPSMPLSTPVVLSTPPDTGTTWTPTSLVRGLEIGAVNLPRWNAYVGVGQPHLEAPGNDARHTDIYASAEYLVGQQGNSLTAYGYWGKASLSPDDTDRRFHRLGLFANVYGKNTKATAGYLTGSDDAAAGRSLDNSGYFLLAEQRLSERWAAYTRYDHFRQDLSAGGVRTIRGPALGVSWWVQTQVRLTLEGQLLKTSGEREDRVLIAEFMWAF